MSRPPDTEVYCFCTARPLLPPSPTQSASKSGKVQCIRVAFLKRLQTINILTRARRPNPRRNAAFNRQSAGHRFQHSQPGRVWCTYAKHAPRGALSETSYHAQHNWWKKEASRGASSNGLSQETRIVQLSKLHNFDALELPLIPSTAVSRVFKNAKISSEQKLPVF